MFQFKLQNEDFELILDSISDGVLILDNSKKIIFVNKGFCEIFSLDKEIIGQKFEKLLDFEQAKKLFFLLGSELKETERKELQVKDDLFLEVSCKTIKKGEEPLAILILVHDISKAKMVDRLKTQFVSVSAHQLRTPLSGMKWSIEYLLKGKAGSISTKQQQLLEKVFQLINEMTIIVHQLLQVARAEEGKISLNLKKSDLLEILYSAISLYEAEMKRKKIKFQIQLPKEKLPKIRLDPEYMGLVFQALLDNAIKYNREGGEVEIALFLEKKEIKVAIRDTGIGIPEKEKPLIFSRFYRATNAQKMVPSGSGTGLFLSKVIIEGHQGKIWFESEEGKGTTFYFTLPIL